MKKQSVHGLVLNADTRAPIGGVRVEAWDKDLVFDDLIGSAETDAQGRFTIDFDEKYYRELFDRRADIYFKVFDGQRVLADTRRQVLWNSNQPDVRVVIPVWLGPTTPAPGDTFVVEGRITTDGGRGAADVIVEAWDRSLSADKLLATGATDASGRYSLHYETGVLAGKLRADLEIRVLDPRRDRVEIARSTVRYEAGPAVVIDLTVPAAKVTRATEYERLLADVAGVVGTQPLATLDARAVAYVAERSGWDARMVAMAARAAQLSAETRIPAPHYYALLRSGLSGDAASVHRLPEDTLGKSLALAAERGVIPSQPIDETVRTYREASVAALATLAPSSAVSDLGTMLDLTLDGAKKPRFLAAYRASAGEPAKLWSALAADGFDQATITRLQTDGKLGKLTRQNAPLISRLYGTQRVARVEDLPRAGFYEAKAWLEIIGDDVPAGITREAYAAGLAAQVNLAQPTLVAAELVRRGDLSIDGERRAAGDEGEVARFLRTSHGRHTIGREPVKTWHGYGDLSATAQQGVRKLERLYQITPSNEAMIALDKLGLDSAHAVTQKPMHAFLEENGNSFPDVLQAQMVYDKAQDVTATALNLATMYLSYRAAPNVFVITGAATKTTPDYSDVPGTPTLEDLFQNMDYCACDHCRSVLSPAAYFVELLQFIDVTTVPAGKSNPQTVLFDRRPDLPHLLLSCENTNVVLPYIDLVNEVLEHYVVNGNLTAFTGFNMASDSVSADLLADPQYVIDAAYDTTNVPVFPYGLPFDMPLAALRLYMQAWDSTLAGALRLLGTAANARRESLGLSSAELSILTSTAYRPLPAYFGEPDASTIDQLNTAISNGKTFSRRTAITYEDLVALLRTTFINPGAPLVPLLEALTVPLAQLQEWFTGALDDAGLQALFPAELDADDYGGDVLAWLTANRALIMGLITLTDVSAEPVECDFATVELRFALPDNAANRLTTFEYGKLHRFIRLWKKLGWSIGLTDAAVLRFLPMAPSAVNGANLDAAMATVVASLGNLRWLMERQSISAKKLPDWLSLWDTALDRADREERLGALLRFGVTDLRNLVDITGIDPLAADFHVDTPSLFRFLDAWAALKGARVKVADLDYLLRHRDPSGKLAPTEAGELRDVAALRAALTAVDVELLAPAEADLAFASAKMALVYDATVVDWFLGLIANGRSYRAPLATIVETLPAKLVAADPRVGFDPFNKELTATGVISAADRTAIAGAADTLVLADVPDLTTQPALDAYIADVKVAAQALADAGAADVADLAAAYPELGVIHDAVVPIADPAARAKAVVDAIIPALRSQLQLIALRTVLASQLAIDPALVEMLTSSAAVLHAHGNTAIGVIEDLRALGASVPLAADGAHVLYLEPSATDEHNLYVAAPTGTTVTLAVGGTTVIPPTATGASKEIAAAAPVALVASALVPVTLTLAGLPPGAHAELRWRTKAMAKTAIPASRLYAGARVAAARASRIRLGKAAALLHSIALTPRELRHLAALEATTAGFLDALEVDGTITTGALHDQWTRIAWLMWFGGLKAKEPDENTWVGVLEQPARTTTGGKLVLAATGEWAEADVTATLTHLGLVLADLDELPALRRAKDALDFITNTQQPAADLVTWAVAAPTAATITAIRDALHSRQDATSWRATLQSVNDALRNQRRDALVAYILHHQPPTTAIDTADKLYEHFLIDVQMDACMQTSRIRMALSTVQLFITRCLMSLEPTVSASSIRADHWAWMKRYRVWEANRKVFLYPENWLEPELRDNKSPLFRELESELLKADITDELAEDAYLSYLKKLDEIARLEIVGTHLQEGESGDPDDDILHVFGRTGGTTRRYFYRRFEYGYWTPWEKVSLEIQGDILVPVIWKKQLFLFWLTTVVKPEGAADKKPSEIANETWGRHAKLRVELTLSWGEYYRGKWTSPKSSELKAPIAITGLSSYDPDALVLGVNTFQPEGVSERLVFAALYTPELGRAFTITFTTKNAPPVITTGADFDVLTMMMFYNQQFWEPQPYGRLGGNQLDVPDRALKVQVTQPAGATASVVTQTVFTKTMQLATGHTVRAVPQPTENQWEAPLFYSDEHSVFYLAPDEHVDMSFEVDTYFWNDRPEILVVPDDIRFIPEFEIPDPVGPVVDPVGPVIDDPRGPLINPRYAHVIDTNRVFEFGGASFDAGGMVTSEKGVVR